MAKRKKPSFKTKKKTRAKKKVASLRNQLFKQPKTVILLGGLLVFLSSFALFIFLPKKETNSSTVPSSPITRLVASLSAQTQPIKIDPGFSYEEEELKKEAPERIVIPSQRIDVSVVEAEIVDGYWETATESASFGLGSAYPSESGNTVIFAHARVGLFANLPYVQPEDNVYLLSQSKWYAYKIKEIKTVLPHQVEVISPTEDKTLTLYTCSGFRDAYRFVVVAKPVSE